MDDACDTIIRARDPAGSGRGLRGVSTLAREWGTGRTGTGRTVWFEPTLSRR